MSTPPTLTTPLTLQDAEDRGLVAELARCFDTQTAALALLAKLGIEDYSFRPCLHATRRLVV